MLNLAICQEIFVNDTFEMTCKKASRLGYRGLELAPFVFAKDVRTLDEKFWNDTREIAERYELKLVAFHWLLRSPEGFSITSPSPEIREDTRDFFRALIDIAHILEIPLMVFGSPKQRDIKPGWNPEKARDRGIQFFIDIAEITSKKGITIAFEPLGTKVTNFGATFLDAMDLIKKVDHPNFRLHLDVKAMHGDPIPVNEQISMAKDLLAHVHVNDTNLLGPGMGDVDLLPIIKAFKGINYNGWYSVETFRDDVDPVKIASESIGYLKEVMTKS
ncbi:MAG: sugar phosphate isomerase/epimerase family protein [Candidatus Hodarchaeota archaeon]